MSLMNLTATGLGEKIKNKEISAPEAVQGPGKGKDFKISGGCGDPSPGAAV